MSKAAFKNYFKLFYRHSHRKYMVEFCTNLCKKGKNAAKFDTTQFPKYIVDVQRFAGLKGA